MEVKEIGPGDKSIEIYYPMFRNLEAARPALELTLKTLHEYSKDPNKICIIGRGTSGLTIYMWLLCHSGLPLQYAHVRKDGESTHTSGIDSYWSLSTLVKDGYEFFIVDDQVATGKTIVEILDACKAIRNIRAIIAGTKYFSTTGTWRKKIEQAMKNNNISIDYFLHYTS